MNTADNANVASMCDDLEMNILVVDDEPSIVQLLQMALGAMGFENVQTANGGKEAIAKIRDADVPFDCFLIDIQMPEIDGIDLVKLIRTNPVYKSTPIVMLTAMSDREYIEKAFSTGSTDYITKPFEIDDLITRVKKAARLHHELVSNNRLLQHVASATGEDGEDVALDLEFPVSFDGLFGYLEYPTLYNYIDRMERSQLRHGGVLAVKIAEISEIYEKSSPQEFVAMLSEISSVISAALRKERAHFSYLGSGCYFVLALVVEKDKRDKKLEAIISKEIEKVAPKYPPSDPKDVQVTVGRVYRKAGRVLASTDEAASRARERIQMAGNR